MAGGASRDCLLWTIRLVGRVELMYRIELDRSPRLIAFAGRRPVLVSAAVLMVVFGMYQALRNATYGDAPAALGFVALAVAACLALLTAAIRVACIRMVIRQGRLQIRRGVFHRHIHNIDLWRVRNIDLDRTLVNRLTGDGTLALTLNPDIEPLDRRRRKRHDHTEKVTGIASGSRLPRLHQQLLNVVFLLRGNPVVKGIIQ